MAVKTISHGAAPASSEERRETGLSLIIIGAMLWCFDALVIFFMPAGIKLGQQKGFVLLTGAALIFGAVVMAVGVYLRKKG